MASLPLSDAQVRELREKYAAGARQVQLAEEYGVRQNTVSSLVTGRSRVEAGGPILPGKSRKVSSEQVVAIREAVAAGTPRAEISARFGISHQMVSNIASGRAFTDVGGPLTGAGATRARPLTVEQVARIREQIAAGEDRTSVAEAFGVSHWTIASVLRGATTGAVEASSDDDEVVQMRRLHSEGVSQTEIARRFGTSQQRVSLIVRGSSHAAHGGPIAEPHRRRFGDDEVRSIREAYAAGTPLAELAERHDVTAALLRLVVTGRTYADRPGPIASAGRVD
jgi:transcriptional regulator with XRE-family HTH domain